MKISKTFLCLSIMIHHICNMSEQSIFFIFASLLIFPQQLTSVLQWHRIGLFHFLSVHAYGCKNPGGHWIVIFPGVSMSRYIFLGGKFAVFTFFGVADSKKFSVIIFFWGIELKLNSKGFMSQQSFFQGRIGFSNFGRSYPCIYG